MGCCLGKVKVVVCLQTFASFEENGRSGCPGETPSTSPYFQVRGNKPSPEIPKRGLALARPYKAAINTTSLCLCTHLVRLCCQASREDTAKSRRNIRCGGKSARYLKQQCVPLSGPHSWLPALFSHSTKSSLRLSHSLASASGRRIENQTRANSSSTATGWSPPRLRMLT